MVNTEITQTELEAFINNILRVRIHKIQKELYNNNDADQSWPIIIDTIKKVQLIQNLKNNPNILHPPQYDSYSVLYKKEVELLNLVRDLRKDGRSSFEMQFLIKAWHDANPFTYPTE